MSGKAIHDRGGKFKGNAGGFLNGWGKGGGLRTRGFFAQVRRCASFRDYFG